MVQVVTSYECGICLHKYMLEADAVACEEQGINGLIDGLEVGMVVQTSQRWAWHIVPDSPWTTIGKAESDFEKRIKSAKEWYSPYYIVTAVNVNSNEHWTRYHLVCPVWVTGKPILLYTEPGTHLPPIRAYDAPKAVTKWVEGSKFENRYRGKLGDRKV